MAILSATWIYNLFLALFVTVSTSALDMTSHCAYRKLHDIIMNDGSLEEVQVAWQTSLYAYPLSVSERQELLTAALGRAQERLEMYQQRLVQASAQPKYLHYLVCGATIFLSLYAMAGVGGVFLGKISLAESHAWNFFPIAKLAHGFHQGVGSALAGVQLVAGCTLAPVGMGWAVYRLIYGLSALQALRERVAQLEGIIGYLNSCWAE